MLDQRHGPPHGTIPAMESYGQYCPIARGSRSSPTRWTPLIIRNMLLGARTFTAIRGVPGISKTLLTERLRVLEHYGIVERVPPAAPLAYELTDAGRSVPSATLGRWGEEWLELEPSTWTPTTCSRASQHLLEPEDLPEGPVRGPLSSLGVARASAWLLCATTAPRSAPSRRCPRTTSCSNQAGVARPLAPGRAHDRPGPAQRRLQGPGPPASGAHARQVGRPGLHGVRRLRGRPRDLDLARRPHQALNPASSIVRFSPSRRPTSGSQPSSSRALAMSGWRTAGRPPAAPRR